MSKVEVRRYPQGQAMEAALALRSMLASACERIEVAGSLRRKAPEVKDIELVAVPRIATDAVGLWGDPLQVDMLSALVVSMLSDPAIGLRLRDVSVHRSDGTVEVQRRNGDAYKALDYLGVPVDLFIVRPPADWGVIFTIRTGPADWSQRLVTECQRWFMRVEGGRLLHHGRHVPCPEEADFLAAIGQPWLDPWDRTAERVHLARPGGSL